MINGEPTDPSQENALTHGDAVDNPIVDSELTRTEAIESVLESKKECSAEMLERLELVEVVYLSLDNKYHRGQLVVDKALRQEVEELFALMLSNRFQVSRVQPITVYGWDDETSMSVNNSSGFNFRKIKGTEKLSLHAFGFAIDINPKDNPVIVEGKVEQPQNGVRDLGNPHTLTSEHFLVKFMKEKGWVWGGDWQTLQDYHHFEKKIATPLYLTYLARVYKSGLISAEDYQQALDTANFNSKNID